MNAMRTNIDIITEIILAMKKRISYIYDEEGICGKKMVVIRWNPHKYKIPKGPFKKSTKQKPKHMPRFLWERMARLYFKKRVINTLFKQAKNKSRLI